MSHNNLEQLANNNNNNTSNNTQMINSANASPSLIPKGVTLGLALFALVLSVAGYVFRLIAGEPLADIVRHALILVPLFVIVIPAGFWLGATVMNEVKGMNIQRRNALTLGWLISCVTLLWFMGAYS